MEISSASGALILRNFLDFLIGNGHLSSHLPPPSCKKKEKKKKIVFQETKLYYISGNFLYFRK